MPGDEEVAIGDLLERLRHLLERTLAVRLERGLPGIEEDRVAELDQHLALAHLDRQRAGADGVAQPRHQRPVELVALLGLRVRPAQRVHLVLRGLQVVGELGRVGALARDLVVALVAILAQLIFARVRGAELVLRLPELGLALLDLGHARVVLGLRDTAAGGAGEE